LLQGVPDGNFALQFFFSFSRFWTSRWGTQAAIPVNKRYKRAALEMELVFIAWISLS
jgi:hypothetical protein